MKSSTDYYYSNTPNGSSDSNENDQTNMEVGEKVNNENNRTPISSPSRSTMPPRSGPNLSHLDLLRERSHTSLGPVTGTSHLRPLASAVRLPSVDLRGGSIRNSRGLTMEIEETTVQRDEEENKGQQEQNEGKQPQLIYETNDRTLAATEAAAAIVVEQENRNTIDPTTVAAFAKSDPTEKDEVGKQMNQNHPPQVEAFTDVQATEPVAQVGVANSIDIPTADTTCSTPNAAATEAIDPATTEAKTACDLDFVRQFAESDLTHEQLEALKKLQHRIRTNDEVSSFPEAVQKTFATEILSLEENPFKRSTTEAAPVSPDIKTARKLSATLCFSGIQQSVSEPAANGAATATAAVTAVTNAPAVARTSFRKNSAEIQRRLSGIAKDVDQRICVNGDNDSMRALWCKFDRDNNGAIDYREFCSTIVDLLQNTKRDGDTPMSLVELRFLRHVRREIRKVDDLERAVENVFETIDRNRSGKITQLEFEEGVQELGIMDFNYDIHGHKRRFATNSLFIFPVKNRFRYWIVWFIEWKWFDRFILACILANSIILALRDYEDPGSILNPYRNSTEEEQIISLNSMNQLVEDTEDIFTKVFLVESFLKIIGMGFIYGKGAYMQSAWNALDFFVVVFSLAGDLPGVPKVSALRTVRVLRPLRTLSNLRGMRTLVFSLLSAIPSLVNVLIILAFVFTVFGILGVMFWAGALDQRCRTTEFPVNGIWELADPVRACGGAYNCGPNEYCGSIYDPQYSINMTYHLEEYTKEMWSFKFTNFDNIGFAVFTLFQSITLEGWTQIMYNYQDGHDWAFAAFYFVCFTIVGAFFLLQFVFAVIWERFSAANDNAAGEWDLIIEEYRTTENHTNNTDHRTMQSNIIENTFLSGLASGSNLNLSSDHFIRMQHSSRLRRFRKSIRNSIKNTYTRVQNIPLFARLKKCCRRLVLHNRFSIFIVVCILLNTICLAMDEYPMDEKKNYLSEKINLFLTLIFCIEMFLKLLGLGLKEYCEDNYNLFDGVIVILSFIEIAMDFEDSMTILFGSLEDVRLLKAHEENSNHRSSSGLSALRTFRLFRIMKLARSWQSLRDLLSTIANSVVDVANFGLLLVLLMYVFALIGMQFFATKFRFDEKNEPVEWQPYLYENNHSYWDSSRPYKIRRSNFDDTLFAFMTIFQLLSEENWTSVMADGIRTCGWSAALFFLGVMIIGNIILLNLFLAILLGNFGASDDEAETESTIAKGKQKLQELIHQKSMERIENNTDLPAETHALSKVVAPFRLETAETIKLNAIAPLPSGVQSSKRRTGDPKASKFKDIKMLQVTANRNAVHPQVFAAPRHKSGSGQEHDAAGTSNPPHEHHRIQHPPPHHHPPPPQHPHHHLREEQPETLEGVFHPIHYRKGHHHHHHRHHHSDTHASLGSANSKDKEPKQFLAPIDPPTASGPPQDLEAMPLHELNWMKEDRDVLRQVAFTDDAKISAPGGPPSSDRRSSHRPLKLKRKESYTSSSSNSINSLDLVPVKSNRIRFFKTTSESLPFYEHFKGDRSLFLFREKHFVRRMATNIVHDPKFEAIVLLLIASSSIQLSIDNPLNDPDSDLSQALGIMDNVFTAVFFLEMFLKVLYKGFLFNGKQSYLRDPWNILDFGILISSIATFSSSNKALRSLRSLRTLRALRPLRVISRVPGMKRVVNALISSIPSILNVFLVCSLVYLIFGIVGTNLFKGKLYLCDMNSFNSDQMYALEKEFGFSSRNFKKLFSQKDCEDNGGQWILRKRNYDNVFKSAMTLFEISTTEGWVDLMYQGVDATEIGYHPVENYNRGYAFFFILENYNRGYAFFFIFFIIMGSFFTLNLFVGAVIDNFNRMRDNLGTLTSGIVNETQREWLQIQEFIKSIKLIPILRAPRSKLCHLCFDITQHRSFEKIIAVCVLLNTLMLGIHSAHESEGVKNFLSTGNMVFWTVFLIEALMKFFALGKNYFRDNWNRFDFAVVIGSTVSIYLQVTTDGKVSPVANALRAFRMGLALRLMKKAKSMQDIVNTILDNMPALINVSTLMFLIIFVYAVIGMQLYAEVMLGDALNEHAHFRDIFTATLTLFRFTTGESWNDVMYDLMIQPNPNDLENSCREDVSYKELEAMRIERNLTQFTIGCSPGIEVTYIYFISYMLLTTYVMINLFVAVILEGFEETTEKNAFPISQEDLQSLAQMWQQYDPSATGWITDHYFMKLLRQVPPPLGILLPATRRESEAFAMKLNLQVVDGKISFHAFMLASSQIFMRKIAADRGDEITQARQVDSLFTRSQKVVRRVAKRGITLRIGSTATLLVIISVKRIQALIRRHLARRKFLKLKKELEAQLGRSVKVPLPSSLGANSSIGIHPEEREQAVRGTQNNNHHNNTTTDMTVNSSMTEMTDHPMEERIFTPEEMEVNQKKVDAC